MKGIVDIPVQCAFQLAEVGIVRAFNGGLYTPRAEPVEYLGAVRRLGDDADVLAGPEADVSIAERIQLDSILDGHQVQHCLNALLKVSGSELFGVRDAVIRRSILELEGPDVGLALAVEL